MRTFWTHAWPHLTFLLSLAFIDAMVNVRYPGLEPGLFWSIIPSVDVFWLAVFFAVFAWNGWRVPKAVRWVLIAVLLLVRLIRMGDGVQQKYFSQTFNLYTDLRLVPELVRFSYSTLPRGQFVLAAVGAVALLVGLIVASYAALGCIERYLAKRTHLLVLGGIFGFSFVALSPLSQDPEWADMYFGGLAASVSPRLRHEGGFLISVYGYRSERVRAIAETEKRLDSIPSNLAKLHGTNVFLIFVESYGRTVFDRSRFVANARPTIEAFESELLDRGFAIASGTLSSPTYGGHSWLAHSTLSTGITIPDELQFELVSAAKPKTIARFFHDAGYRTMLVQPGTTREWPKGDFYQFDQKVYAWNFNYAGPQYAWATMPDQYVLDFVRRNELPKYHGPLFVQYVLVSSHAPWSELPSVVDDWNLLGDGSLFWHNETMHYPITWPNFANASQAYIDSIIYDFDVLRRYISQYVVDDSLLIILGDHQPVAEVNGYTPFQGVPIHVLSRDGALVEPFVVRGFGRGMYPPEQGPVIPMANFLVNLVQDFSTAEAAPSN